MDRQYKTRAEQRELGKRGCLIQVTVTAEERQIAKNKAKLAGIPLADLVRHFLLH